MDIIGKLNLDDEGIKLVHKNYIHALKESTDPKKMKDNYCYIPAIRSLVMRNQQICEYCNNHKKSQKIHSLYNFASTLVFKYVKNV